jgi:hypothetical protein
MTAWTSFMKAFYSNERKKYSKCAKSGTLKRAAKIYNCQKKMIKKSEKKRNTNSAFTMTNPMLKNSKFRKTMKNNKSKK